MSNSHSNVLRIITVCGLCVSVTIAFAIQTPVKTDDKTHSSAPPKDDDKKPPLPSKAAACALESTTDGLEQQQEDLNKAIAFLEARQQPVESALLGMGLVSQSLPKPNDQTAQDIDRWQAIAKSELRALKGSTITRSDLPQSVKSLRQSYSYPFTTMIGLPMQGEGNNSDPQVALTLAKYTAAVRQVLDGRIYSRLGDVDEVSSEPKEQVLEAIADLNSQNFQKDMAQVLSAQQAAISALTDLQQKIKDDLKSTRSCRAEVIEARGDEAFMNRLAIKYGLPWFCLTAAALFLFPQIIRGLIVLKNPTLGSQLGFSVDKIIELVTILFISLTILILGLASKIDGQVLGTLLGGISGYVLNRISRREGTQDTERNQPKTDPNRDSAD